MLHRSNCKHAQPSPLYNKSNINNTFHPPKQWKYDIYKRMVLPLWRPRDRTTKQLPLQGFVKKNVSDDTMSPTNIKIANNGNTIFQFQRRPMTIDDIPTSIEYLSSSSSSIEQSLGRCYNNNEQVLPMTPSRYDVPMEFTIPTKGNDLAHDDLLDHCLGDDITLDKYSVINDDDDVDDDDECNDEITFGSFDNDTYISDTILHDEIQKQREQIKQSFILQSNSTTNNQNDSVPIQQQRRRLFDFVSCFGNHNSVSTGTTSRNVQLLMLQSPKKYPIMFQSPKSFRKLEEIDHILHLD